MGKLSHKQEMFCREYLLDLNATQAAIRAGYSKNTAYSIGHENLKKPEISDRISELLVNRIERTETDADYVLIQARELHERCMQEISPVIVNGKPLVDEQGRAVFRFDSAGAARSLELIGKHVAVQAFKDQVNVTGEAITEIRRTIVRPKTQKPQK